MDIVCPFTLTGIKKNNNTLYQIKSLKPKNFKKWGIKLNIYSAIPYNFTHFTCGNVQKIPEVGEFTNVQNCLPNSVRNSDSKPNNIIFFLIFT